VLDYQEFLGVDIERAQNKDLVLQEEWKVLGIDKTKLYLPKPLQLYLFSINPSKRLLSEPLNLSENFRVPHLKFSL
jgi:hypothetical protein